MLWSRPFRIFTNPLTSTDSVRPNSPPIMTTLSFNNPDALRSCNRAPIGASEPVPFGVGRELAGGPFGRLRVAEEFVEEVRAVDAHRLSPSASNCHFARG